MSIDIRIVAASEQKEWLDRLAGAFFETNAEGAADYYFANFEPGRSRGAFDGDAVVGTLRSFHTELTVPGPAMTSASALTAVSVAPTHRRQGILTRMITADLRESAERGEAVSILLASEYPIYSRFGYGPATEQVRYEIATTGLRFLQPREGSVELVDLRRLREVAPPVYERFRAAQPGSITRPDDWWDRVMRQVDVPGADPWKGFQAVYRSPAGDIEGYVMYEGKPEWGSIPWRAVLSVDELMATTPAAYQALWEFCCNVDLQTLTAAGTRAPDEVLPLLVDDARRVRVIARSDFLWVRILDVCAALASRRYASEGHLVLEVTDDLTHAAGRFVLDGAPGEATCTATKASPDLTLPVGALGSAYLGGMALTRLAAAGLVEEHRQGALARADVMFMTARVPWCTTGF